MNEESEANATNFPDWSGEDFLDVLARIHQVLRPKSLFEIGTWTGNSLKLASCPSLAVDLSFHVSSDVIGSKSECHFFQMSSDDFFQKHSPSEILQRPIDLAFIDGMHLFEITLRDFANVERHCRPNSIIAIHDCLPTDAYIAARVNDPEQRERVSTRPGWWTGDVWKILPILAKYRPDLKIVSLDAPPTGLVLVTNLYPQSTILLDRYMEVTAGFSRVNIVEYGLARLLKEANPISTHSLNKFEDFGPDFWL